VSAHVDQRAATRAFATVRAVAVPFVVSRVLADVLIVVMARTRRIDLPSAYWHGFAKWDGSWYASIARFGYNQAWVPGQESPWPFFPLLPGIMRVLHWLGPTEAAAAVVVNHGIFFFGLIGLALLARRHFDECTARLAVWTIALFPSSFLFSMAYPSAIFFAGSVWAFLLVETRRDVMAAIATLAVVMVRPNGFLVAFALVIALRGEIRRIVVVCGPAALAFGAWCLYNLDRTGDALTFYKAKDGWPEIDLVDFVLRDRKIAVPHLLLAAAAVLAVVLVRRKLPAAWIALTALMLVLPLAVGMVGMGRYAGETFPPFVAAGATMRTWPRAVVVAFFTASAALMALCAYWVIHLDYIP
jgi:hypothetical protein